MTSFEFVDITAKDGSRYRGMMRNGKFDGPGTLFLSNGSIFSGDWQNHRQHGRGTWMYANGDLYEGDVVAGKRHGYGVYIWNTSKNQISYEGFWMMDLQHGMGTEHSAPSRAFQGRWVSGKKYGLGILTDEDRGFSTEDLWSFGEIVRSRKLPLVKPIRLMHTFIEGGDSTELFWKRGVPPPPPSPSSGVAVTHECAACYGSGKLQAVLVPCGHSLICVECAEKLVRCPICRQDILIAQKIIE